MKIAAFFVILFLMAAVGIRPASSMHNAKKYLTDTVRTTAYTILGKSENIASIAVRKGKKNENIVYIKIGQSTFDGASNNGTGLGISGKSRSRESQNASGPVFDQIEILSGNYEDIKVDKISTTQNEFTLVSVHFPLRLKMHVGKEFIEFELKEPGSWDMDVRYKK
ncbi:hypothetical protein ACVWYG_003614 [Pedobacter sp. UYEF25]